jgi:hypothetical protein
VSVPVGDRYILLFSFDSTFWLVYLTLKRKALRTDTGTGTNNYFRSSVRDFSSETLGPEIC